jgi:hypothetical protein
LRTPNGKVGYDAVGGAGIATSGGVSMTTKFLAILGVSTMLLGVAFGAGQKTPGKVIKCPVCHMPLWAASSKAHPTAVKLSKTSKVLFCCAGCKMPASILVKKKGK